MDELVAGIRRDLEIDSSLVDLQGSGGGGGSGAGDSAANDMISYTVFECLWKQVLALGPLPSADSSTPRSSAGDDGTPRSSVGDLPEFDPVTEYATRYVTADAY